MKSLFGQMGSSVERNNIAENDFLERNSSVMRQFIHDFFHFVEEFGSAELADDEIITEGRITKGFSSVVASMAGTRIEEELKGDFRIFLLAKQRGETERRYHFHFLHFGFQIV